MTTRAHVWAPAGWRAVASLAVVALAPGACQSSESTGSWEAATDTLPHGVVRVVNSPPAHAQAGWTLVEELRVGAIDEAGPESFGSLRGLAALDDGGFAVLDAISQEVRVFDDEGRHDATFGGKGAGPGELEGAFGLMVDRSGRLWVPDTDNARLSVFHPVEGFESSAPLELLSYAFVWRGRMMNEGTLWKPSISLEPRGTNVMRVFDTAMALVDSLPMPPDPDIAPADLPGSFYWEAPDGRARAFFRVPFFPGGESTIDPRGAVWSTAYGDPSYRIARWEPGGDTTLVIETRRESVEISTAVRDSAITAVRERMRGRGAASQDWSKVPTVRPAVLGMFVSDEGELWVRTPVEDGEVFDVYDREGQLQRTVSNPLPLYRWVHPTVRGDELWAIVIDSLDVHYVVRARIVPRGDV